MKSAIAVIGYQRIDHLAETLRCLSYNYDVQKCPLYIFIDGPKDTAKTSQAYKTHKAICSFARSFQWGTKKNIIASDFNRGLRKAVCYSIDTVLSDYQSVIIVEDDIVCSPYFYRYMKHMLTQYHDDNRLGAVCGHCYHYNRNEFNPHEPYFLNHFACWGWGTWRRAWEQTEWSTDVLVNNIKHIQVRKKLDIGLGAAVSGHLYAQHHGYTDSWDAIFGVNLFLHNQLCVYPTQSLTTNIGWRGEGSTHVSMEYDPNAPMAFYEIPIPKHLEVQESQHARKAYANYFYPNKLKMYAGFLKRTLEYYARKILNRPVKPGKYKQAI